MRAGIGLVAVAWAVAGPALALESVTVNVTGIAEEYRDAIISSVELSSLAYRSLEEPLESDADLYGAAVTDYGRIIGGLYGEGFYGPQISILIDGQEASDINPFSPPGTITNIVINVDPGARFDFGKLDVSPRPEARRGTRLLKDFETGKTARSGLIGSAANTAVNEWRDAGHAKVDVGEQKITADHKTHQLDVAIGLVPGPQLRFGALTIDGDRDVSDKRVRQIMGFPTGEIYSPEELRTAVNRVRRTGTFATVSVSESDTPNADGTLDYQMTLIEDKPRRFGFDIEYSSVEGISVGGFWLHRNLFGGAERLRIEAQVENLGGEETGLQDRGGEDYTASMRLTRPGTFGADNDLFTFATIELTDDPDYKEDAFTFGVGVTRYFTPNLIAEVSGGLRYSEVEDAFGDRTFKHAVLPSRLEWDKRDDRGDAKEGFFVGIDATPYLGIDGSQSGALGELDLRAYHGFGPNKTTVLAGRVQLGSIVGSDLDATPPDFLFFSGGGGTVRGQKYESLGVEQSNGLTSGGRSFLGASAEVRQLIRGSIGAVAFVDVGYIGEKSFIDEEAGFQAGAGLGARVGTPIGPIRVDLATPISEFGGKYSSVELYIGVGQAF
ncbi:autotransporter assembly complex protein TamA [Meridianimarinicoccus aquatilis]|uniref:Outer membrane protein assembly factor n=1 Tax=Meridianimarinicoccus aquatilis TaxID=2552766 RepID=A0A4R6AYM3_9RHOB|nr:autotransporter assembly complex family protein [Fluviibacterium aquatile]QIE42580.1 outer membrane protein assembly factor [Rhodobacteraceae bacterium SC52]TDL87968.1 outer membrane protein assembly factor [Fluviibacterium aquatile]